MLKHPKIGLYSLVWNDGCACGGFDIQGIGVDISCGRGAERAIRVYRTSDLVQRQQLEDVAAEVKRQVDDAYGRDLPIMFETYQDSREARALDAWRAMPAGTKWADFLVTFEVHE